MQQRVNPGNKSLADYRSIVRRELYDEVAALGERLRGRRVLHVSATSFGGGVAEILYTLVPLMRDVGLEAEWDIMFGSEPFFNVTKSFHNALQGADYDLTVEDRAIFEEYNRMSAEALQKADEEWDIVLVHDPQPALLKHFSGGLAPETKWIWRCHPDLSTPNREVLDYLVPHIADYDAQIYTMQEYTPPEVQLALVGSMASDDPEGWDYFNATIAHASGDPDIHILNNFNNVGAIEVNAFQSHSDVLIQKSTREGFGLTVSEAIWKGRPFIGGNVGGIPLQVQNGVSGYLVDTAEECAERSLDILQDPALGKALGRRGKEHVRKHFLTPRYLRDYLKIIRAGLDEAAAPERVQQTA